MDEVGKAGRQLAQLNQRLRLKAPGRFEEDERAHWKGDASWTRWEGPGEFSTRSKSLAFTLHVPRVPHSFSLIPLVGRAWE